MGYSSWVSLAGSDAFYLSYRSKGWYHSHVDSAAASTVQYYVMWYLSVVFILYRPLSE